ncbi:MAG TPA: hypothetical protein VGI23_17095, partial [Steroidobacteraceae bacterium]
MGTRKVMGKSLAVAPIAGVGVVAVERLEGGWVISATGPGHGQCPACGTASSSRHSSYSRHLQDLPALGAQVT